MLKYLAGYEIDHHSRVIVDLIPLFLEKQLPSLMPYLKSRMLKTDQSRQITKYSINENFSGIIEEELWFNKSLLDAQIMQKEGIDKRVSCEVIDIPFLYHYGDAN